MYISDLLRRLLLLAPLLLFALTGVATGQNADPLIYTVGKVFPTGATHHAYVLWQPGNPAATYGKRFAVYRKDGDSGSADPYVKLGETGLQTGPGAIQAILKLGGRFDFNAGSVADRINTLYADSTNEPGTQPAPPAEPGLAEAEKLAYLLNIAKDDLKVLERVFFLGRAHPGVYMALGHGFAIKVDPASVHTYEIREVDGGGNDLRVIGRVTLDAANPTMLTATSRPFEIFHEARPEQQEVASANDHLVTRMRWGTPNSLRRLLPHTFGFNLYRVREQVAVDFGWHLPGNSPPAAVLEGLIANELGDPDPDAKRVNELPIIATALMTAAEAADLVADSETFFAHDDNDPPDNAFTDGETFYYFVAARDIAGHPGPVSDGTRVVICDRLPPTVPMIESVRNIFSTATVADLANLKGNQHFRIRIRQVAEEPVEDAATKYHIYRWGHHTQHITDGGNPATNLVATVNHVPGKAYVDYDDTGAGAPRITPANETEFGKTHWYTVRSEDDTACKVKNLSGHSPPAFGVLRDRVGPGKPSGLITRCRYLPRIFCEERPFPRLASTLGLDADYEGFVARFRRTSKLITSVDLELVDSNNPNPPLFKTTRFFSVPDVLDVPVPILPPFASEYVIRARARSKSGLVSPWVNCDWESLQVSRGQIVVVPFDISTLERCTPVISVPGETPSPHDVDTPTGGIVGPEITMTLPAGTKEYRIYRRVGHDGAYQMIDRGSGSALPSPLPGDINHTDSAPPTVGDTEICYFGQVFDENGNSGPRVKLGCVTIKSGDLGMPMLSDPELLATDGGGNAQVRLSWFCDPVGVDRFEIWCASDSAADPGISSNEIGPKLDTLDGAIISSDSGSLAFCGYQTKALGGGFGDGTAEFELVLTVPASQTLTYAVRAVGKGVYQNPAVDDEARPQGPFSNAVSGTWKPPAAPDQPVIPWPALAVPDVADVQLAVANYQKGEGPFHATPLPVGDDRSAAILMGVFESLTTPDLPFEAIIDSSMEPLDIFFSFRRQNIHPIPADQVESIVPFAIYRHQLPTPSNPDIVPNLIQVSPLIDRIGQKKGASFIRLRDRFFRFSSFAGAAAAGEAWTEVPVGGTYSRTGQSVILGQPAQFANSVAYLDRCNASVYWVDPLPVARGARYQYLIVHFTERGEIDRVIPTNYIDQP